MAKKMTKAKIRKLAEEIREFLLDHEMWVDTAIYFNGIAFSTQDKDGFWYNDREHLVELQDEDPRRYFKYVGPYLSMSFEGPFYEVMNGYLGSYGWRLEEEFRQILKRYGLYAELGNAWNLTVYEI